MSSQQHVRWSFIATGIAVVIGVGCLPHSSQIYPPAIDPSRAGAEAIEQYDTNGDGQLSTAELASCPGILGRRDQYDSDGNDQVSADEIAQRIESWLEREVGIRGMTCRVVLNRRPLAGAQVRLIPEPFLGPDVKPARGTTAAFGVAPLGIAPEDLAEDEQGIVGVHLGLYKVEITHPRVKLPARYNTASTLGAEITATDRQTLRFELRSR